MKNALIAGLSVLSIALAAIHYDEMMNKMPKELAKRTKVAWYIGCVSSIAASGAVLPPFAFEYCNQGYKLQDFEQMNTIIESEQEIFFENH